LLFILCAAIGGGLFAIRLVLFFLGGLGDTDADGGDVDVGDVGDAGDIDVGDVGDAGDVDVGDAGGDVGDAVESAAAFKLLTLQGITAFLAMFGLVGLACYKADLGGALSVGGGIAAGAVSVAIITNLLAALLRLQSSGTISLKNAIGQDGTVYLRIPADGTGKVQVEVQERLMVLEAVSADKVELKTDDKVKVVGLVGGRTLSVKKL
ncbi:MAG: hypothetical protein ACYS9X_09820, partial [Planctomycetota bacterium]